MSELETDVLDSDTLTEALKRHSIELAPEHVKQLDRYCKLVWEWNTKLNLTRHTDYEKFVSRDLVDSLELSKLLGEGEEVLDVGSGGGVPGIPLAILRPDLHLALCESVGKKATVLETIIRELRLPTPIYNCRVEDLLGDFRFDVLVARAVGPLWKMLSWLEPKWHCIGRLLAMKGPKWPEERGEARHRGYMGKLSLRVAASYPMAGTESDSVILKIWPKGSPER
ncbi:MAG: 16S rRNA (guanine(527)-N(7))-methyltransferase RsmG [Planctomycetes bacterium]|nr:16S rRNA (guanine(527)-N(7))-methyltransferase RsmG [Planctomycetota bacterium]